jgi:uncharacterized protein YjiS (DUF1127 family)
MQLFSGISTSPRSASASVSCHRAHLKETPMMASTELADRAADNRLHGIFETRSPAWVSVVRRLARWRNYHRTLNQLERLNEEDLRDLAINKTDFDAIARGVFVRE